MSVYPESLTFNYPAVSNIPPFTIPIPLGTPPNPTPPPVVRTIASATRQMYPASGTGHRPLFPAIVGDNPFGAFMLTTIEEVPDTHTLVTVPVGAIHPGTFENNIEQVYGAGTYTLSDTIVMSGSTQALVGIAGQTIIQWTGPATGTMVNASGAGPTIVGITFTGNANIAVAGQGGSEILVHQCDCLTGGVQNFCNFTDPSGAGSGPNGWTISDCVVGVLGSYSVYTGGTNGTIVDCSFAGSINEHIIRGTGNVITIQDCEFTNASVIDSISPQGGDKWSIISNIINPGGGITIGPILTAQAVNPPIQILTIIVGNNFDQALNVGPGTTNILIEDNNITATPTCLNINGAVATYPKLTITGLAFDNNNCKNNGADGQMLLGEAGAISDVALITTNTYSQSGVEIGNGNDFSASVTILDPDLSHYNFEGNEYGKPKGYTYQLPQTAPFKSFCVGGQNSAANYQVVPKGDTQK